MNNMNILLLAMPEAVNTIHRLIKVANLEAGQYLFAF